MSRSQFGQAEYILSSFEQLGISHGTCFEAGASRPDWINNSMPFIEKGWKAYLVELDEQCCNEWKSLEIENVSIINAAIGYNGGGLKRVFDENNIPYNLDVLFLDILCQESGSTWDMDVRLPKFAENASNEFETIVSFMNKVRLEKGKAKKHNL